MILGLLRNKYRDDKRREIVNELHFYHRTTYMAERVTYYTRQEQALRRPSEFMSDIGYDMASDKTTVPSCSDRFDFKPSMKQHVSKMDLAFRTLISSSLG